MNEKIRGFPFSSPFPTSFLSFFSPPLVLLLPLLPSNPPPCSPVSSNPKKPLLRPLCRSVEQAETSVYQQGGSPPPPPLPSVYNLSLIPPEDPSPSPPPFSFLPMGPLDARRRKRGEIPRRHLKSHRYSTGIYRKQGGVKKGRFCVCPLLFPVGQKMLVFLAGREDEEAVSFLFSFGFIAAEEV